MGTANTTGRTTNACQISPAASPNFTNETARNEYACSTRSGSGTDWGLLTMTHNAELSGGPAAEET